LFFGFVLFVLLGFVENLLIFASGTLNTDVENNKNKPI
jgi:hypothetical protein